MMGPSTGEPRPLSGSYVSSSSLVGATDSASASAARTRYSESPTDSDLGYSSILSSLAGSPPRLTSEPMQAAWGERAGQVDPFTPAPTLADSHDGARIRPGLAVSVPAPDLFTQIRFRQVSMSVYPEQQTPAAAHAAHHLSSPVSEYSLDGCDEDESGVVNHRTRQQSISNRSSVHDGSTLGYPTDSPSTPGMPSTPPDSPTDSVAPLMVASSRRSTASSSERSWSIRSGSPPGEQQQRAHYQTTQQRQASQHPRKAVNPKVSVPGYLLSLPNPSYRAYFLSLSGFECADAQLVRGRHQGRRGGQGRGNVLHVVSCDSQAHPPYLALIVHTSPRSSPISWASLATT